MISLCRQSDIFSNWADVDAVHRYSRTKITPLALLVLCALRYLGRSWTIDDLEEATEIDNETIRTFLHKFIEFGSTELYEKYVNQPLTNEEMEDCQMEYLLAEFSGCIGSTDASHIVTERCAYRLRQMHLGFKLAHTSRTYNMTVNHRRRILSSTKGHPARFNDKTLILFDTFMMELRRGVYDNKHSFSLYDHDDDGNVISIKYNGCYVIVDNGYMSWSTTVPPMKESILRSEIRFSEWLESLRKDVECTFGIMKKRWMILKHGIRLHGIFKCDQVWLTCCALHNLLLDVDNFNEVWGQNSQTSDHASFAVQRLNNPGTLGTCVRRDLSGNGMGDDCIRTRSRYIDRCSNNVPMRQNGDKPIIVNDLSMVDFRNRLVRHFNIAFKRNEVKWPKKRSEANTAVGVAGRTQERAEAAQARRMQAHPGQQQDRRR